MVLENAPTYNLIKAHKRIKNCALSDQCAI